MEPAPSPPSRSPAEEALLDAAERLLVEVGYANIRTRGLAREAGVNHGLIHYYFGSMDELFVQVLHRFTQRLVARQRRMYAQDRPFIEKWRAAMDFIDEDLAAGYPKILLELNALAWNEPALQDRLRDVNAEWRAVLAEAFAQAQREYGLDESEYPVRALVALVMTFNVGLFVERLIDVRDPHRDLLGWIDAWLESLEAAKERPAPQ